MYRSVFQSGFAFESSHRIMNQNCDKLSITYVNGMKYVRLTMARLAEEDGKRMADISKPETYDLSLYPFRALIRCRANCGKSWATPFSKWKKF